MQCVPVWGSIFLKIVPSQTQTGSWRKTLIQMFKPRLTARFHGIEIDHHCPGSLPTIPGVVIKLFGTR